MKLEDHPTVRKYRRTEKTLAPEVVDRKWLRKIVLDAGADAVGFVEIEREELSEHKEDILRAFAKTKSVISFVCRLNRLQLQSALVAICLLRQFFCHLSLRTSLIFRMDNLLPAIVTSCSFCRMLPAGSSIIQRRLNYTLSGVAESVGIRNQLQVQMS